jgi:hypothetical protein
MTTQAKPPGTTATQLGLGLAPPPNLPLALLRHGSGLIGFGLLFGFAVPFTPYPRLGLTAHIQFAVEGTMVVAAGLLLNARPFSHSSFSPDSSSSCGQDGNSRRVVDYLGPWQRRVVYWGVAGIWVTLLSEVANAWWGTQLILKIAHGAAGLTGTRPAEVWMERVVAVAHKPFAMLLATVVSLFQGYVCFQEDVM